MQLWFKQNADVGPEPDGGEVVDGDVVVPLPMSVNVMTRRLLELWQRAKGYDPEGTFAKPVLPELRRSDPETARLYERDVALYEDGVFSRRATPEQFQRLVPFGQTAREVVGCPVAEAVGGRLGGDCVQHPTNRAGYRRGTGPDVVTRQWRAAGGSEGMQPDRRSPALPKDA